TCRWKPTAVAWPGSVTTTDFAPEAIATGSGCATAPAALAVAAHALTSAANGTVITGSVPDAIVAFVFAGTPRAAPMVPSAATTTNSMLPAAGSPSERTAASPGHRANGRPPERGPARRDAEHLLRSSEVGHTGGGECPTPGP